MTLRGPWGWSLFGVVWGLAVIGGLQELWPENEARVLSVVIYVLMGWAVLVALVPLWTALGPAGFIWVAAGGLDYTVGIAFYVLDDRLRHGHGVWHLFVLAGSVCHYVAILRHACDLPEPLRQPGRPRPAICQEPLARTMGVL